MSNLDAILAQYEKNTSAASSGSGMSNEDRLKRYFTTLLPKGQKNAEKRIRILPTQDGTTPFKEAYFHEIQVDGKWVKLYDPKQEGKRSPLNEVAESLKGTGIQSDAELAKQYYSRKFYIVKVIDRDNEQDGVKYWRFKHTKKGDGIFDKIIPLFRTKGDVTDPKKGRDLILSLSLAKANNGKEYTIINSIIPDDPSPLSVDKDLAKEWLSDESTWNDVYAKKPEDYLEIVARGEVPKYSKSSNKWVSSEEYENGSEQIGGSSLVTANVNTDDDNEEEVDSDLPF